jgi:exodeoxyribonuclease V alpha subunit
MSGSRGRGAPAAQSSLFEGAGAEGRAPIVAVPVVDGLSAAPATCSALDRAFARMLVRRVAPARSAARPSAVTLAALGHDARAQDPLLYHTALLVSAERALGNSCVELAEWSGKPFREDEALEPFCFPDLETWSTKLTVSGACDAVTTPGDPLEGDRLELAPLVLDGTRLYLRRFHDAERQLADAITMRLGHAATEGPTSALFDTLFPHANGDGQAAAARTALRSPLVFVTGGPGTGKTTIAARLLALLLDRDPSLRIALAAPTGRAAARLGESMNAAVAREALPPVVAERLPRAGVTLHRLLGYRPWDDRFAHSAQHPLAEDVVVVDEASMVDVLMMQALFAAVKPGARLIVLGDPDQLASVDTGFVLGDVVRAAAHDDASPALRKAVARLTVSYRFGTRPGIGALADAARTGNADAMFDALADARHTEITHTERTGSMSTLLAPLLPQLERYLRTTTADEALAALGTFRVLCGLRDTDAGVTGLNASMERWVARRGRAVQGWYAHRPVLITQNDPATQLFNGDVGTTLIVDGDPLVYFPGPAGPRAFAPSRLPAHETAWAMTVHKAQGSEFDHVLFVLPEADARILTRELVYTGITRARESVTLVGSEAVLRLALARSVARASGLVERLLR